MGLWTDVVGTVRGYIRLGLTGVRLKDSSGALAVRNAGDSAYAKVECDSIELGHISDTTLARVSAGVVAVEGITLAAKTGVNSPGEVIIIAVSDETTAITTGVAKVTFRMPFAMTLTAVRATLSTASSSGLPAFDVNESGVSVLSTVITIDATEKTSTTAVTPPVISDSALADDAEITVDIDVAGTGTKGAKIYLLGYRT